MNIKKVFTFALAGALSISMLAGCGSSSNESTTSESKEDTSLTDVQAAGHFTLGLDADFAPMGFTDDNGEIVGFDIDLAKAVGEKMGVDVEVKPIDWDSKDELLKKRPGKDGARQIRRLVQTEVEGPLASYLLRCGKKPARVKPKLEDGKLDF